MVPKRLIGLLVALLLAGVAFGPNAAAQDRLSIATGGTGGVYYPYGGALASLISNYVEDTEVTAEVTAASVDNMLLIESQDADLAFVLGDTAADAVQGNDPFQNPIPGRTLATLYDNFTHIVVKGDSEINTVADLRGKRVSTGSPGSGTEVIANRILTAGGLNPDADISREQLGVSESAGAMRDGRVDAFFWSGGLPTAAITDLGATPNVTMKLLPHADIAPALQEQYGAVYSTATIPANTYPNQTEDVEVVIVPNVLVAHEEMDEELVYNITKAMFEHRDDLVAAHPAANDLTLENAIADSPIPYHPGALRYYQEQGATPVPPATPAT
ncbi:MAG: TAXI family TRAP transporter solute-binding subunit [Chloroflexia bacterium]|nr:TAXI family TRAP transporter solute-binding subunit [Chloroflexia bacterium]